MVTSASIPLTPRLQFNTRGIVAMANGGPDTNKSQVRDVPSVPIPSLPLHLPVQTISPSPLVLLASPLSLVFLAPPSPLANVSSRKRERNESQGDAKRDKREAAASYQLLVVRDRLSLQSC
jgi:hypothetical protein